MRRRDSRIPRTLQIAAAFEGEKIGHIAGDIVRFRGDGSPLRSLRVGIDPVQDLHGYDSPWPAGGGKNKLLLSADSYVGSQRCSATYENNGATFTASGTYAYIQYKFAVETNTVYTLSFKALSDGDYKHFYIGSSLGGRDYSEVVITDKEANYYCTFTTRGTELWIQPYVTASGTSGSMSIKNIQLELGSSQTPYAPYSNLCPISGWTEANLWRTGKNLLGLTAEEMVSTGWNRRFPITIKAGTYIISCQNMFGASTPGASVALVDETDQNRIVTLSGYRFGDTTFEGIPTTITEEQARKIKYIRFDCNASGATFADIAKGDIQLELGSTATPYTPYTGTTATIQLGQTVYGGTLDVINGVLTVDRAMVDLGTLSWNKDNNRIGNYYTSNITATPAPKMIGFAVACSQYAVNNLANANTIQNGEISSFNSYGQPRVFIKDIAKADLTGEQFTTAMSGVQLVYELATPITIPLTSQEISTLAGQNVLWADCGEVDVEYVADNGVEGGKLALLLRNKPELLIAMRKGGSPQELLLAMGSRGDAKPSITPLKPLEEKKDEDEEAMRKW